MTPCRFNRPSLCQLQYYKVTLWLFYIFYFFFQVCEQCQNVKYEREGYFLTVDIEKGMQDGQVSSLHHYVLRFLKFTFRSTFLFPLLHPYESCHELLFPFKSLPPIFCGSYVYTVIVNLCLAMSSMHDLNRSYVLAFHILFQLHFKEGFFTLAVSLDSLIDLPIWG